MLEKLKSLFKKKKIAEVAQEQTKSAKQIATDKGEAYFAVLSMELDPMISIMAHLNLIGTTR